MTTPQFPDPTTTPVSEPFWRAAAEGRLTYQRCAACDGAVFPPRAHCPHCWAQELRWCDSAGTGILASYAAVHRPGHPAFAALAPYTLALVDLDEGFRMLTRLVADGAEPAVGAPVMLTMQRQGATTLPLFSVKETS